MIERKKEDLSSDSVVDRLIMFGSVAALVKNLCEFMLKFVKGTEDDPETFKKHIEKMVLSHSQKWLFFAVGKMNAFYEAEEQEVVNEGIKLAQKILRVKEILLNHESSTEACDMKEELRYAIETSVKINSVRSADLREQLIADLLDVSRYWAGCTKISDKDRCDGVVFSVLKIIDGIGQGFPYPMDLVVEDEVVGPLKLNAGVMLHDEFSDKIK